jgi:hypothetical protein
MLLYRPTEYRGSFNLSIYLVDIVPPLFYLNSKLFIVYIVYTLYKILFFRKLERNKT